MILLFPALSADIAGTSLWYSISALKKVHFDWDFMCGHDTSTSSLHTTPLDMPKEEC